MAATYSMVDADWSVNASKVIDYIGDAHGGANPSYGSGIEFHRWLADLSDNSASINDDLIDRAKPIASKRFTNFIILLKNGYTVTGVAIEHLYDCSITSGSNQTEDIWDGITVFGNCPKIHVLQSGLKLANDFWNNDPDALGFGLHSTTNISHKFLVKVRENGVDIDGRRLIGTTRAWNKTWKEFAINGSERGKNTLALDQKADLNNTSSIGVITSLVGISNQVEGYSAIDADGDTTDEFYYSSWTKGSNSTNDLYEYVKSQAYDGSTATLYGLPAASFRGITHEIDVDTKSGVDFAAFEAVSWSTGAGQLLAINSVSNPTKMWIQLMSGVAPSDNDVINSDSTTAACLVNVSVVTKDVEAPLIGTSTGAAIIAAFGFGVVSALTTSDKLTDLTGAVISPPDVIVFTAGNLFKGSATLYPWDGVAVDADDNPQYNNSQMTLSTALLGAEVEVVVNAIPDNTPDSGFLRITLDNGSVQLVAYSARNTGTNTYVISDAFASQVTVGAYVWNAYIDSTLNNATAGTLQFTYTYGSDIKAVLEIRDPANLIEPYIQPITLGSTNQTVNAIRNSDA